MEENQALFSLTIDPGTKAYLNETAKWARFLAIVTMIVLILVFIFTVLAATVMDNSTLITLNGSTKLSEGYTNGLRIGMVIGSLVMIGIAFIPLFYLLQFATRMRKALAANQQDTLNSSFHHLKRYFRFLGIVVIIVLVLYACAFVISITTGNNTVRY